MARANANSIEIAYDIIGSGEPLLMIGGFGMTREFWGTLPLSLADRFQVIVYDNRGAGESTIPTAPFSIADMAEDAIGLMDALQIRKANIFGVSMGGMIGQLLCAYHPGRIGKAILGCTGHGGIHAIPSSPLAIRTFEELADPELSPEAAARMLLPVLFSEKFVSCSTELVEQYVRISIEHAQKRSAAMFQMGALMEFDAESLLGSIRTPVLVVTGSEDILIPPENSKMLARKLPDAKLEVIQGAGHNFFFETPETARTLIEDFLAGSPLDNTMAQHQYTSPETS